MTNFLRITLFGQKSKNRHFLAQSRTADFLMFPRLVLAQSHKTSRFRRRLPHSLKNFEFRIVLLCLLTVRSSSISNTPHPWKSCRNHFSRNRIRSLDRCNFSCFSPTAKTRVPDTGSLSYHISSSHIFSFRNFLSFCLQYGYRCHKFQAKKFKAKNPVKQFPKSILRIRVSQIFYTWTRASIK